MTQEVGQDMLSLGVKKLGVYTDSNLVNLSPVKQVLESLTRNNVPYVVYDDIRVEPTGQSFQAAAEFAKREQLDSFLAVGGGSVGSKWPDGGCVAPASRGEEREYKSKHT